MALHLLQLHCHHRQPCQNQSTHLFVLYGYGSVPHIQVHPPFCNLSTSWKRRGGLYAGSDILSRIYAPTSGTVTEAGWHQSAFASLVLRKLKGQDRLTEVGHSIDGGVSKHSAGLSFQCATALTPLADTLATVGKFLSCFLDAGLVLALPLHHEDLGSVGVSTKDHVAILVAWGGLYAKGGLYAGHYGIRIIISYLAVWVYGLIGFTDY